MTFQWKAITSIRKESTSSSRACWRRRGIILFSLNLPLRAARALSWHGLSEVRILRPYPDLTDQNMQDRINKISGWSGCTLHSEKCCSESVSYTQLLDFIYLTKKVKILWYKFFLTFSLLGWERVTGVPRMLWDLASGIGPVFLALISQMVPPYEVNFICLTNLIYPTRTLLILIYNIGNNIYQCIILTYTWVFSKFI